MLRLTYIAAIIKRFLCHENLSEIHDRASDIRQSFINNRVYHIYRVVSRMSEYDLESLIEMLFRFWTMRRK